MPGCDGINEPLEAREIIGQAVGLVMARYQISEDQAFAFLVRASSQGNIRVHDIAHQFVYQAAH